MAMTVNGKIAKPDGDSDFTSKVDGKLFLSMCRKAGNAIIGKNTYIDIEPLILGRGIPLFADGDFAPRLKLLGVKTLTNNQTVQLHYKVIK